MKSFQSQTHYEVLEISVSASADEVKSAFERLSRLYGDDQVVLYGMVDGGRAAALRARLREAFEVLTDDERRDRYDVSIGLPPRDLPLPKKPAPRPSVPERGAAASAVSAPSGWGSFAWVSPSSPTPSAPVPTSYVVAATDAAAPPPAPRPSLAPAPVVAAPAPVTPAPAPVAATPAPVAAAPDSVAAAAAPVVAAPAPVITTPAPVAAAPAPVGAAPAPVVAAPAPVVAAQAPVVAAQAPATSPPPSPSPVEAPLPGVVAVEAVVGVATPAPASRPPEPVAVEAQQGGGSAPAKAATEPPGSSAAPEQLPTPAESRSQADAVGLGLRLLSDAVTQAAQVSSSPAPVPAVAGPPPAVAPPAPTPPPLRPLPPLPGQRAEPVLAAPPRESSPDSAAPAVAVASQAPEPLPVAAAHAAPDPVPPPVPSAPPVARAESEPVAAPPDDTPRLGEDVEVAIVPVRTTSREFRIEQRPRPYEVPPGVEFNGDLLRQVRMARGLSLVQLSERTRIGVKHLENVEADRYDALPAGVYLRGILMNLARELGLDGLRVAKSYLTFVEAHRSKG